jgi:putative endonuclease
MARRSGEDRRRSLANLAGADAERLALALLIAKGYWPLARRYLSPAGEIDLVMRRGRTIVAVEVKARATMDEASAAITPAKIRRIGAALAHFRSERRLDDSYTFRCDAVLVAGWLWPRHLVNAGELGEGPRRAS